MNVTAFSRVFPYAGVSSCGFAAWPPFRCDLSLSVPNLRLSSGRVAPIRSTVLRHSGSYRRPRVSCRRTSSSRALTYTTLSFSGSGYMSRPPRWLVPAFFDANDEAVSSFGLFESNGVALLVRRATVADDRGSYVSVRVRVHGDEAVGERLREALIAWDRAGRPSLTRLLIRAIPIEHPYQPQAGETMLMRVCTRLVLEWSK
jgi:hypothetical protein